MLPQKIWPHFPSNNGMPAGQHNTKPEQNKTSESPEDKKFILIT